MNAGNRWHLDLTCQPQEIGPGDERRTGPRPRACDDLNPGWQPGDPIAYINPHAPAATVPPYRGKRYEALVPDTFDVAERGRQVINPLTEATDVGADREIYFMGVFCVKPALLCHGVSDANVQPKFQLTVPLMRMISGSEQNLQNLHVETEWITRLRRCIGPDGLFYLPLRGRPWEAVSIPNWIRTGPGPGPVPESFATGMTLTAMTLLERRESGEEWSAKARALVDGLIGLAVDEGDIAYFWPSAFRVVKERPAATEPPVTEENGEACRLPYGLMHAYRLLGHEPALTLAGKNLRYLRRYFFREDGSFLREPGDAMTVHFHEHSRAILTMLEYAASADDEEMMGFALRSFEWVRNLGVHPQGRASSVWQPGGPGGLLVGYFPEFVNSVQWHASELCNVADMIALAIRFSELGRGDYWDDADRWTRNMFAEGQLQTTDWIDRITEGGRLQPAAGRALAHRKHRRAVVHGGRLRLNLLMNHASRWADVDSFLPYQGRVEVRPKVDADLAIRIPEWVAPGQAACAVNGARRELAWDGRYAQVGTVGTSDRVTLTFPIGERTDVVYVEKHRYVLTRRGNDVVDIDPPGRYCPLYQRRHYRDGEPRLRAVTRFVSSENVEW